MNCYDDLTQFLMIISTFTAEIKYGPFLLIDTKISHWNWTPMTCFILSHKVLPMAFPMIAVVKLISNNHTNSNQPYDCYLSPFISRSNDHTNSIQILWSLLTNIVPTHSNIANFLVAAYTRHMAKIPEGGDLPNDRIPAKGDLPSITTKAPTLLYSLHTYKKRTLKNEGPLDSLVTTHYSQRALLIARLTACPPIKGPRQKYTIWLRAAKSKKRGT